MIKTKNDKDGIWTDINGKTHLISEMENSYLINCMRFIERRVYETLPFKNKRKRLKFTKDVIECDFKYSELEKEFIKRAKNNKIQLKDFFLLNPLRRQSWK